MTLLLVLGLLFLVPILALVGETLVDLFDPWLHPQAWAARNTVSQRVTS